MRTCTGFFLLWIRFWIFSIFLPFEYPYSWRHWSVRSHDNSWAMVMVRWPSWRSSLVSAYCLKLELEVCLAKGLIHGCNPLLKIYHVGVLCIALVCSCRARICRFPCFLISSYICSKATLMHLISHTCQSPHSLQVLVDQAEYPQMVGLQ